MSNIYSEILLTVILFFLLFFILNKIKLSKYLKICFYIAYVMACLIVLISINDALYFTDGVDYLNNALNVLEKYSFNPIAFLDFQSFITSGDSWHFIPNYEFALFIFIFNSTKCISIFHIFLMQISILIWYLIFIKLVGSHTSKIFMIIMLFSLYLQTFTISALKDPIVFFLVALISYILFNLTKDNYQKKFIMLLALLLLFLFTRIYDSVAMFITILLFIYFRAKPSRKQRFLSTVALIISFLLLLIIPIFRELSIYLFSKATELLFNQSIMDFIIQFFIRFFNLYFSPIIINIFNAQYLYFGCYIESFMRTLLFPVFIIGFSKLLKLKQKKEVMILLFIPIFVNILSLTIGDQSSPIRQYMWNYQTIIIILSLGINEILYKKKIGGFVYEKCLCCHNSKT